MGVDKIRFPNTSGIGIKPVSKEGTARIVRAAIQYAIDNDQPSVGWCTREHHEIHRGWIPRLGLHPRSG